MPARKKKKAKAPANKKTAKKKAAPKTAKKKAVKKKTAPKAAKKKTVKKKAAPKATKKKTAKKKVTPKAVKKKATKKKAVTKTTKKKTVKKKAAPKATKKKAAKKKATPKAAKKKAVKKARPAPGRKKAGETREDSLRRFLVQKRKQIFREAQEEIAKYIKGENRQLVETALDDGDWSVIDLSEDISLRKLGTHRETLLKIDEALRKLSEGTYGTCEDCGDEISAERLRVLPFAIYCRDCQEAREEMEAIREERSI
jgi:DnaK suppressor protein